MDIAEVIIQDARKQGFEEAEQQFAHKIEETKQELTHKFEEDKKLTILNLQKKGFSNEDISEVMDISIDEVLGLIAQK